MSNATQSQTNITAGVQHQGSVERAVFTSLTTLPCCIFLYINGVMLFTMRSKAVLRETPRYILLYNLLFGDTVQLALAQLLYLLAACKITLTFPVCGILTMLCNLTSEISPLTLVVMSLERYVAVCYPLRHAAIITIRSTDVAIALVWTFSFLNILIQVILLLNFPFEELDSLQMNDFCSALAMRLNPMSDYYDRAYTCVVFLSAAGVIICSYIGVMFAARSASTGQALARKARNTVLLHLIQLGLILSSTMYSPLIIAMARTLGRLVIVRIINVLYVCIYILPRCLSALIYGLRDQNIRPILMYHLCCRLKLSVVLVKADV
ncbi:odorant receptor 131-2-like [Diretmus argenteus]